MTRFLLPVLLACAALAPTPSRAAQSYDSCKGFIDSLPATLFQEGTYCLRGNLSTSQIDGSAILVTGKNVTIDCHDFRISGLGAGAATQARGIASEYNGTNLRVRNCQVRGFAFGVHAQGSGTTVEDSRLDRNTVYGLYSTTKAIYRRNRVTATGGSTVASTAAGIAGAADQVRDNLIDTVTPRPDLSGNSTGYGMHLAPDAFMVSTVTGNRIRGVTRAGLGVASGIVVRAGGRAIIRDNDLDGDHSGLGRGLVCASSDYWAKDNYVREYHVGMEGCIDGGNVIVPAAAVYPN
ncbi:right-handed parallel beta-helix repeat-containing protein [Agrilutibacter solisilvae]|uniref:Right-handed parallel beta-helix repeat-containing protein n=1 Tax=Agrilutibacter solisilvae TaxID=2763317 RepID=A0A974XVY7_9GAMM|nr:right-handed parallel beta-helix repeat-containing protein [Lysobacter solisilvae]QSX76916.1 right-handed parallel beta-helix repeat-containing protein [Lysobacter solisilvae]